MHGGLIVHGMHVNTEVRRRGHVDIDLVSKQLGLSMKIQGLAKAVKGLGLADMWVLGRPRVVGA